MDEKELTKTEELATDEKTEETTTKTESPLNEAGWQMEALVTEEAKECCRQTKMIVCAAVAAGAACCTVLAAAGCVFLLLKKFARIGVDRAELKEKDLQWAVFGDALST